VPREDPDEWRDELYKLLNNCPIPDMKEDQYDLSILVTLQGQRLYFLKYLSVHFWNILEFPSIQQNRNNVAWDYVNSATVERCTRWLQVVQILPLSISTSHNPSVAIFTKTVLHRKFSQYRTAEYVGWSRLVLGDAESVFRHLGTQNAEWIWSSPLRWGLLRCTWIIARL
jgi:hypothetical protein